MLSTEKISMSLSGSFGYSREAVRVKVKKCEGSLPPEYRKFSIDPEITSFEVLQSIIAKAFEIKGEFTICYRAVDDFGQEAFLPLLSDWDLDAAFLSASDPCLTLQVDTKQFDKSSKDRSNTDSKTPYSTNKDVFGTIEITRNHTTDTKPQNKLPTMIMNRMEKTLNIFQRALNLVDDQLTGPLQVPKPPLADVEFRKFLGPIGQLEKVQELRTTIYYCGIEPCLRKVVWKHVLNVYPDGLSGKQRMDYMKKKSYEYELLREAWRESIRKGHTNDEIAYVTSMVRKDVLRTDRHHKFYAGNDDNENIASLFNILTTFALNHRTVSYCQGMSDLASPLLVTMGEEAHAYICFCALMQRLKPNFMIDGVTMTLKFQHLTEGLIYYDPEFHSYLKSHQAEDLLFCYRWLLLEMKREFAFDDALHMLEVLWSSLPASPPQVELQLYEQKFDPNSPGLTPPPVSPLVKTPRENPYTKVCALRRQSSSVSLSSVNSSRQNKKLSHRQNQSLDESILARQNRLRLNVNLKPFSSLDDNSVQLFNLGPVPVGRSKITSSDTASINVMKKRMTNYKLRSSYLSCSTGNLIDLSNKRSLSKRLPAERSESAINQLSQKENDEISTNRINKGRIVKNLNEFLNFSRERSQCNSISETSDDVEVAYDVVQQSPDDSAEYYPMTNSITHELRLELENLDRKVFRDVHVNIIETKSDNGQTITKRNIEPEVFVWENPIKTPGTPDEQVDLEFDYTNIIESNSPPITRERILSTSDEDSSEWSSNKLDTQQINTNPCVEAKEDNNTSSVLQKTNMCATSLLNTFRPVSNMLKSPVRIQRSSLPPPHEFGGGNPFLMFLCLTLLRQHRDYIMRNNMDYNEMAMHFDKMVRKHNVSTVLDQARQLFSNYLKQHTGGCLESSSQDLRV